VTHYDHDAIALVAMPYLVALLLHWLPLWRRQNLWFGITVPAGFSATLDASRALKRYRIEIWVVANLAASCLLVGAVYQWTLLVPAAVLGQMIGASVTFATVRRTIAPFAVRLSGIRSVALSTAPEGLPGGLAAVFVPLGMLAATAAYLRANWLQLPERFPIHWSLDGTPNGWGARTWQGVFGPLVICALVSAFMIVMAELIIHTSPRGRGTGTERWTTRFRRANLLLLVAGVWGTSAMICVIALMPLFSTGGRPRWLMAALPVLLIGTMLPFVWQLVRITQEPGSGSDGTPDHCWKFGQIYYNPSDPAIMIEKRFGVGYTLNLGNRMVWWILGVGGLLFVLVKVAS
jgi:uncharacterized membrane protein